jgi:hypothetical protein
MAVIWSAQAPILGGVGRFSLVRPDNVWVSADGIVLRGQRGSLSGTLNLLGDRWSVHAGLYLTPAVASERRFATARDRRRVGHALVEAWGGLWTPEAREAALPAWFRREWDEAQELLALARSPAQRRRLIQRQNELLKRLTGGLP